MTETTKGKIAREIRHTLFLAAAILASRVVLAEPYYVPTASMEPTLDIGDHLLANKNAYGYSRYSNFFGWGPASDTRLFERVPERGDVVLFRLPSDPSQTWVKRVVGLPGDRIQVVHGRLRVNGGELPLKADGAGPMENSNGTSVQASRFTETLPGGREHTIYKLSWSGPRNDTKEVTVPAGHLFMMGDDRDNSADSRVPPAMGGAGLVPMENLVGRAELRLWSWDFPNMHATDGSWLSAIRFDRFFSRIS